ncbi:MAG: hypothetical protein HC927_09365 [Deltaproteobacteria bacterium]|nr:hypothetical protein [Deltaproteobacteria bacterium]
MTDETENLVIEILKRMQGDMALMRDEMRGIRLEMTGIKQHIAAFFAHEVKQDSEIDAIKLRLDRIERRLELKLFNELRCENPTRHALEDGVAARTGSISYVLDERLALVRSAGVGQESRQQQLYGACVTSTLSRS